MGSGLSVPKINEPGTTVRWSFFDDSRWVLYPPNANRTITEASKKGEPSVDIKVYGKKYRIELLAMKEFASNNKGSGSGNAPMRDIKCEVVPSSKLGELSPSRPPVGGDEVSDEDKDRFESELLDFLVGNSIRYIDLFGLIDKDRNRFITKTELHNFFKSRVWKDTPLAMTERVFAAMEQTDYPGRINFRSFERHASAFKRVSQFEETKQLQLQAFEKGNRHRSHHHHHGGGGGGLGGDNHVSGGASGGGGLGHTSTAGSVALAQMRAASASVSLTQHRPGPAAAASLKLLTNSSNNGRATSSHLTARKASTFSHSSTASRGSRFGMTNNNNSLIGSPTAELLSPKKRTTQQPRWLSFETDPSIMSPTPPSEPSTPLSPFSGGGGGGNGNGNGQAARTASHTSSGGSESGDGGSRSSSPARLPSLPPLLGEGWLLEQRNRERQLRVLYLCEQEAEAAVAAAEQGLAERMMTVKGGGGAAAKAATTTEGHHGEAVESSLTSPSGKERGGGRGDTALSPSTFGSSGGGVVVYGGGGSGSRLSTPSRGSATTMAGVVLLPHQVEPMRFAKVRLEEAVEEHKEALLRHDEAREVEKSRRAAESSEEERRVKAGRAAVGQAESDVEETKRNRNAGHKLFLERNYPSPPSSTAAASSAAAARAAAGGSGGGGRRGRRASAVGVSGQQGGGGNGGNSGGGGGGSGGGGLTRRLSFRRGSTNSASSGGGSGSSSNDSDREFESLLALEDAYENAEVELYRQRKAQASREEAAAKAKVLRDPHSLVRAKEEAVVLAKAAKQAKAAAVAAGSGASAAAAVVGAASGEGGLGEAGGGNVGSGGGGRGGEGVDGGSILQFYGPGDITHGLSLGGGGGGSGGGGVQSNQAATAITLVGVANTVRLSAVATVELALAQHQTHRSKGQQQSSSSSSSLSTSGGPTSTAAAANDLLVLEASDEAAAQRARDEVEAMEAFVAARYNGGGDNGHQQIVVAAATAHGVGAGAGEADPFPAPMVADVAFGANHSTAANSTTPIPGGGGVAYKSLNQLRKEVKRVFEASVPRGPVGALVGKRFPAAGEPGYYPFADSALGQVLFNKRGMVSEEFMPHQFEITPFFQHLKGDRAAWGALLTSIFNRWSRTPGDFKAMATKNMRYIVFDPPTRNVGFSSLLREDWASLTEQDAQGHKAPLKAANARAAQRFGLSHKLEAEDPQGVDFFVSHNWNDDNAPHRWATMMRFSDLYKRRYGRLPRFWLDRFCIDQTKPDNIDAATAMLPATLMSCKSVLVLQSPYYLGCSNPSALPSLWCIVEFFTLCSLAPHDDPTRNLIWVPLFEASAPHGAPSSSSSSSSSSTTTTCTTTKGGLPVATGGNVPPKLDLLHGRVYCFSAKDKEKLLTQLACCPGGLVEVQRSMSAVWPVHFREAYAKWALLTQAAAGGDEARVEALLGQGASVDLPFEWSPLSSGATLVMVAAAVLHEHWRYSRKKELVESGGNGDLPNPRWKKVAAEEFEEWFVAPTHQEMVKRTALPPTTSSSSGGGGQEEGEEESELFEVNIDVPFGLLPPSWKRENIAQAKEALGVLREWPDADVEYWASLVHESWLERRRKENNPDEEEATAAAAASSGGGDGGGSSGSDGSGSSKSKGPLPAWVVESNLHVPFDELVEAEKEKDRVVVRTALLLRTDGLKHVGGGGQGLYARGRAATLKNMVSGSRRGGGGGGGGGAIERSSSSISLDDGSVGGGCGGGTSGSGDAGTSGSDFFGGRQFDEDGFSFDGELETDGSSAAASVARQPLQAAVQRFLEHEMRNASRQGQQRSNGEGNGGGGGGGGNVRRGSSTSPMAAAVCVSSCLDDPCVKLLLEAGADPIAAVNQTILGDPLLDDALVFRLLKDLLGPIYRPAPHCLSLLHNQLTPAGVRRILRFKQHVNLAYEEQQQRLAQVKEAQEKQRQEKKLLQQQQQQKQQLQRLSSSSIASPPSRRATPVIHTFLARAESAENEEGIMGGGVVVEREEEQLLTPLRSLCGLSDEAILANSPAPAGAAAAAAKGSDLMVEGGGGGGGPEKLVRFQAVHQSELRAANFLLLVKELTAPPHVVTLTSLDLSMNAALSLCLDAFKPLTKLKRLACAKCALVGGTLQPLCRSCPDLCSLDLGRTDVEGTLDGLNSLVPHLKHLDLSDTQVRGTFEGLGGLKQLRFLRLAKLRFVQGPLFPALNGLHSLRHLDVSSTGAEGSLAGAALQFPSLQFIDLEYCRRLRGSIEPLSGCRSLEMVNVNLTELSGGLSLVTKFKANCPRLQIVSALQCPRFLYSSIEGLLSPPDKGGAHFFSSALSPNEEEEKEESNRSGRGEGTEAERFNSSGGGTTGSANRTQKKKFLQQLKSLRAFEVKYVE